MLERDVVISITPIRWYWPVVDKYTGSFAIRFGPVHFWVRYGADQ